MMKGDLIFVVITERYRLSCLTWRHSLKKQRLGVTLNPSLHIETKELPYCHHKAI